MWHEFTPWLVLALGLVATAVTTAYVAWTAREQAASRFEVATLDAEEAIASRIEIYRALLRSAAAMIAANENVTRQQFHVFAGWLRLQTNYPGIQGIGFSRRVRPNEKESVVALARAEGFPDFTIHPERVDTDVHTILYLEPLDARNRAALGFDMSSEPTRRAAMERARDTGSSAASGRVTLVQEIDEAKQAGFLIYTPIYRGGAVPPTVEERREKLLGFAYAPFRVDDLFAGIFGTRGERHVEFDAYDGTVVAPETLLHRSTRRAHPQHAHTRTVPIQIVQRPWTLVFHSTRSFERTPLRILAPVTAALGLAVTGFLVLATYAQRREHWLNVQQQIRETQRTALRADIGAAFARQTETAGEVLQSCTDAIMRYLPAAFARIWLVDPQDNVLVLHASSGLYTHLDGPHGRVPVGELKIGRIAADRVPHLTNDVAGDPLVSDREWALRQRMVAFAGYPLMVEGRAVGVIAIFAREALPRETLETLAGVADIIAHGIQRRYAEDALRKAEENLRRHANDLENTVAERTRSLRATIDSLEKFSYTIAHDLRAPVRAVHSFATLLMEDHGTTLDSGGQQYLQRIIAAAQRMDRLIEDLLAYNRIEHERVPITRVALESVFAAVIAESHFGDGPDAPTICVENLPEVMGNPTLLHQVATNLINNAIKFVPKGTPPRVHVSAVERGSSVRVIVRDNGIGIEPAHQDRIFGLFERLHGQQQYAGTGVGLAIVAKALEKMGGKVGVESAPGQGASFWFELPRAR